MELVGMSFDKLIMIFAGLYIAFIWPQNVSKKINEDELDKSKLKKFKWLRPAGIILILISTILFFVKK